MSCYDYEATILDLRHTVCFDRCRLMDEYYLVKYVHYAMGQSGSRKKTRKL